MVAIAQLAPLASVWLRRLRFTLAVAVLWAGLHFLAGALLFQSGLDRPLVLSAGKGGLLGGLVVTGLLWAGAVIATLLTGTEDPRQPLLTIGLALALWAGEGGQRGGTMDAWLILRHPDPGPPSGAPYWLLLTDYVWLLLGVGGAYCIGRRIARQRDRARPQEPPAPGASAVRGPTSHLPGAPSRRDSLMGLLLTTLIAGASALVLTGSPLAYTRRAQVYFALLVGFLAAVFVTSRVVRSSTSHLPGTPTPAWCWPAPFLLGVIGLVVAGVSPGLMLRPGYERLDTIPAWALARPLPVEMIGAGLVGVLWLLGPRGARAAPQR
jgi:hypothetical protein